ncbi:ornithine carbamoyltransferase [Ruficoccus amylovorans]|uniref:Ornithine carbamoyltransferase n=1 Tax=Ruficoccus amylovorans TaxID=1804625 RepID=A0A842HIV4_9BACT|nr:ornithine carbamoyltransferase [Ruficoccus amylovorans]MBC2596443.1 ornithine carbamoyltransferase [Ruficoccus amylovorans]
MKHFLKVTDFSHDEVELLFQNAAEFKRLGRHTPALLQRQSWGMLFYKNSTRTRVSFEVGLNELGAHAVMLSTGNMQLSRGETIADTARVLSRYLSGLIIRCYEHSVLEEFASAGTIPVVNALTDLTHPCQLYADLFTLAERWSPGEGEADVESLRGRKVAFLGDTACNMANSWILAAAHTGMEISLAGPAEFAPSQAARDLLKQADLPETFKFTTDAREAVRGADVVYTDVWVSMGNEAEEAARLSQMQPYSVTADLMAEAAKDAYFMHCLPAHAGQEVSQEVLDSSASIIFDEAENRLHIQKAILAALAGEPR